MNAEFLRGFEEVTRVEWPDSEAQWIAFARNLSEEDRKAIEAGGYENGLNQGRWFNDYLTGGPAPTP